MIQSNSSGSDSSRKHVLRLLVFTAPSFWDESDKESDKESGTERKRRVDTEKLLLFFCEDEEIIYLCRVSFLF